MNTTKRSFLTSVAALVLCISMLIGTTFAWFTDSVTSGGNIIQTGLLDIDLMKGTKVGDSWVWESTEGKAIFDYDKWEPGYTASAVLAVENHGTLSAKWTAKLTINGTPSILADVIDIYVTSYHNHSTDRPDFNDGTWQKLGSVRDVIDNDGLLLPGEVIEPGHRQPILVALHMRTDAGNEYQDLTLGTNFDITILATQATSESDSFGNDYDADAKWPELDGGYYASTLVNDTDLLHGALTGELTIGDANGIGATLPADVKIADGATSLDLTMKKVENSGNVSLNDGENVTSFDVHIAGIASDNTKPMIVNLGPVLAPGIGETELKLYHIENGTPVLMTRVNSASEFAIHNHYTYDPTTGNVSIYVASFSVFSAVKPNVDIWDGTSDISWYNDTDTEFTLTTAEQFAGFRDIVDGKAKKNDQFIQDSFVGKTVKLGVDINLNKAPFDPIGYGYTYNKDSNTAFMGIFDGQNHTIYNLYQNCWELDPDKTNYSTYTYSTAGAGLFASIEGNADSPVEIKNLAVSGAEIVFECVDMGIVVGYAQGVCHFENIVVTNSNIANYNRYTGGVVGEVSYGPYGIDTSLGYSHTFKNVTVDSTVTVSGLWGSFGCGMGGVIGGKWGDATVKMENVVSAPVMDVYNDVVSAYQWYAFRGCGMLIGHTEEPYSDGRTSGNATAGFLKCVDVYVYYGDWVNYHYYEFKNQDNGTGRNYPWVRAEAGKYCDAFSNIRYGVPTHNGVKVSDLSEEELKAKATNYTPIVFNQLYGADRGMYGTDKHDGVTVAHKNTKTIYFMNANEWTDLKLHYYYVNGDDTWTNVPDGISLGEAVNKQGTRIYKVTVPAYANEFYITGAKDGQNKTMNASVAELIDGCVYYMTADQIKHCEYKEGYKTVYFENNKGWNDVYLYYWCNDGKADWGTIEFPGEKMKLVSSEGVYDVYSFVIPAYADGFVIGNGIKVGVSGNKQTDDISVADADGKIFYINEQNSDGYKHSVHSVEYVEGYKTFTFANNWVWSSVNLNYNGNSANITSNGTDIYKTYNIVVPNYASSFTVSGPSESSVSVTTSSITNGSTYSMFYISSKKQLVEAKKIYLKPGTWKSDNARFSAYVWSGNTKIWVDMKNIDNTYYGTYIPKSYNNIIFGRMNPSTNENNFNNGVLWNQTGDLTYNSTNTCFQINGYSYGEWIKK